VITIETRIPKAGGADKAAGGAGSRFGPLLDRLLAIEPGPHRVVSCYVRLAPEDRQQRKYLADVKQRIAAVWEAAADPDLKRITDHLADARNLPPTRGLALFASEALGLFEAAALPEVHRTRVMVDDTPWIRELVAADQDFGTLLAAVVDRAHARFFSVTAFGAAELPGLYEASSRGGKFRPDRQDSPGWGEADYHGRIREERHRHLEAVAHHLESLVRAQPPGGILLAGPLKETAALAKFLRPGLGHLVLGPVKLNPTATTAAQVQAAAFAAAAEEQKSETAAMVATLEEALGSGWAVNGPRETLRALARGQVRTLLVREGAELEGFRCSVSGRLVLSSGDCRGLGVPTPVLDLIDEAVEEALGEGVQTIVLENGTAGPAVDRLAAFLRFR
jgi:peptide subunit release factor 1 (eRF1)